MILQTIIDYWWFWRW